MYPRARAGFQDFFSDLLGDAEQAAGGIASGAVQSIVIESAAFPAITLSNPLAGVIPSGSGGSPAPASPPPFLLSLLKPRVTVNTAVGQFMLAPGGAPPAFPWLMWTGLGVVALAAYGAATLLAPQRGYARRALPAPRPAIPAAPKTSAVAGYKRRR